MPVSPFAFRYQGNGATTPANILIPLERQLIALQLCRWEFLYNETFQQTFRPLLLSVMELLFLSLVAEALQCKMCQNSLPSGGVCQLEPIFQGEGVVPLPIY